MLIRWRCRLLTSPSYIIWSSTSTQTCRSHCCWNSSWFLRWWWRRRNRPLRRFDLPNQTFPFENQRQFLNLIPFSSAWHSDTTFCIWEELNNLFHSSHLNSTSATSPPSKSGAAAAVLIRVYFLRPLKQLGKQQAKRSFQRSKNSLLDPSCCSDGHLLRRIPLISSGGGWLKQPHSSAIVASVLITKKVVIWRRRRRRNSVGCWPWSPVILDPRLLWMAAGSSPGMGKTQNV